MEKIIEAEVMSAGNTKLRLTLFDGTIIEGFSMGIEPAFDADGEELDFDVLVFDSHLPEAYFRLREEDILRVEKVM